MMNGGQKLGFHLDENILITGSPGIGKTTAIRRVIEYLPKKVIGGFYSAELRESRRRIGFSINALDGKKGILAGVGLQSGPRLGNYRVNIEDIDRVAVPAMREARESGRLVLVDEIAKMELFSGDFKEEIVKCLDERVVIGTIQKRQSPFLDGIRSRRDVHIIELTLNNRDDIPNRIVSMIAI